MLEVHIGILEIQDEVKATLNAFTPQVELKMNNWMCTSSIH